MATFQSRAGSDTTVVLPLFRKVRDGDFGLTPLGESFEIPVGDRNEVTRVWKATRGSDGPRVLLLENDRYFDRPGVYGEGGADFPDNHLRFAFLTSATLRILPEIAPAPVVLHLHDWHTALAAVYLRALRRGDPYADQVATVLSVHNGGFQGHFPADSLPAMGLPMDLYRTEIMEWYGRANLLKAGLVFTDMATTVSPSHAFELRTEDGGFGLHHTFLALHDRLVGVLNGIDHDIWDPETDPYIPANYSVEDLSGKAVCKAALQRDHGLPEVPKRLLVVMVARMVAQKGMDLILGGRALASADAQFIFLGSGERRYEQALLRLATEHPQRIAVDLQFNEEKEHRVIAGADALLMPSLYEPCGLTQMRAMRYGAVPLARRVGGLEDTIEDGATGLLFDDYRPERLDWIINRAVARFARPDAWLDLVETAMHQDFSWGRAVERYYDVYDHAFEARAEALAAR
jgi:starch synthase